MCVRKIQRITLAALLFIICTAVVSHAGDVFIPSKRCGIWVTAVCGKGCNKSKGPCEVYVLSEVEYKKSQKTADTNPTPASVGKTPLVLLDVKPGVYYVGISCVIDESVVGTKQVRVQPSSLAVPMYRTRPNHEEFFADDLPEKMADQIIIEDKVNADGFRRIYHAFLKWYKISVEEGKLCPVVGLFLEKKEDPQAWEQYYPKKQSFEIVLEPKLQEEIWDTLDYPGSEVHTIVPTQRKVLTDLLTRGGRVCLPQPEVGVVWIDSNGFLQSTRIIHADKVYKGTPTTTKVTNISRSEPQKSDRSKQYDQLLPAYEPFALFGTACGLG